MIAFETVKIFHKQIKYLTPIEEILVLCFIMPGIPVVFLAILANFNNKVEFPFLSG